MMTVQEREARSREIEQIILQLDAHRRRLWELSEGPDDTSELGVACSCLRLDVISKLRAYQRELKARKY